MATADLDQRKVVILAEYGGRTIEVQEVDYDEQATDRVAYWKDSDTRDLENVRVAIRVTTYEETTNHG